MPDFLQQNIDITELSNFKTSAKTRYYFEINTEKDVEKLVELIEYIRKEKLNFLFVWWWTNMLFAFDIYDWIVIKNNLNWWTYSKYTKILEVYSNENISDIAKSLEVDYSQNLWHRFIWLPWTIWWAVYWNAWCFWLETENNFMEAGVLNLDNWKKEILSKKEMCFEYRNSLIKKLWNYFLINVKFDFSRKIEKYSSEVDNIYFRENKQPKGNTCGSFFKNPSKEQSAWKLIEEVWLKWHKIWWAYFSSLHANFLMNDNWWNYKDLLNIISLAQQKVKENFYLDLIPEVRIINN